MKNLLLALGLSLFSVSAVVAQEREQAPAQTATTSLTIANLDFVSDSHDFGNLPEGAAAEYDFTFKNTGKEPIILQKVQPSCGCTTPTYSKEPVLPGKNGVIKVSYATKGRPGQFNKSITVVTNAGTKVLMIHGKVEKAPTTSVPTSKTSIMRTN